MNRIKVKGNDGKWYWYNPKTKRLFRSQTGMDEIPSGQFTYKDGAVTVHGPYSGQHGGHGGKGSYGSHPENPYWDPHKGPPPESKPHPDDPNVDPKNPPKGPLAPHPDDPKTPPDHGGDGDGDGEEEPPEHGPDPCPEGWTMDWEKNVCVRDQGADDDTLALIEQFLDEWGLSNLSGFVKDAIQKGWSYNRILLELRKTPEYLAAFPENGMRKQAGYSWMSEADILRYRNEAKRLVNQYFGAKLTDAEISNLIGSNISLSEFEHKLVVGKRVQDYGPAVKSLFESAIGYSLSDDDLEEFLDEEQNTEEWDRAYENARFRGQPTLLGLDERSQEEADLLRALGFNPDTAFQRYQEVALNRPRFERLAGIESEILDGLPDDFGAFLQNIANDGLVRGLVFQDPGALAEIQALTSRELARFRIGGGAAFSGTQAAGLLSAAEREAS